MKLMQSLILFGCVCLLAPSLFAANTSSNPAMHHLSDSEIMGIVMTVDKNEIAAANVAKTKQISHSVKKYAEYLKKQHEKNLQKLNAIAQKIHLSPAPSSISKSMVSDGEQGLKSLQALNGQEFEKAYIDAMIKGHRGGLNLIKTRLLTDVTNTKLGHFLVSFKSMVAHHLKKALKIQKKLNLSH